jgi:hypothetical protein
LEGNGPKFLNAQSRQAAREAQKNSATAESQCIQEILIVKKTVDLLKESLAEINKDLAALNEERTQLLVQLKIVEDAIRQKEEDLSLIPASFSDPCIFGRSEEEYGSFEGQAQQNLARQEGQNSWIS